MNIAAEERELYKTVWGAVDSYGEFAPGELYLPLFLQMVGSKRGTVLDAGCGSGKGAIALEEAGFDPVLCDLTADGLVDAARAFPFQEAVLWNDLAHYKPWWGGRLKRSFDYAYCCDVLEHVPVQFTMLVVDQLLRVSTSGVFLSVALVQDKFGAWVGKPLHQTVESFVWWRDGLRELGNVVEARDLQDTAVFFVEPR